MIIPQSVLGDLASIRNQTRINFCVVYSTHDSKHSIEHIYV